MHAQPRVMRALRLAGGGLNMGGLWHCGSHTIVLSRRLVCCLVVFNRPQGLPADLTEHGAPSLNIYLTTYKVGDIVDIVANSYQQKGMPHKCEYHPRPSSSSFLIFFYQRQRF